MLPDSALEEVKRDLRSMLISEKGGVPLKNIQRDYEMLSCNRLPYKELGFSDVQAFMRSIPDVARETRGPMGDVSYFAVCDESTSHIQRLVSSQKSKKKKPPKFSTRGRGGGRGRGGVSRGAFRGGRGGSFSSKPNSWSDSSGAPPRPRPPQSMRGGGRWQRGIPRSSFAADPSVGQSGDWRNKTASSNSSLSTFSNGQNRDRSTSDNNVWGGTPGSRVHASGGDDRDEWDKENQTSPTSSAISTIRNLRIGIDSMGKRTIDTKERKEVDLREQINNRRAMRFSNSPIENDFNNSNNNNQCNEGDLQLSGDLRHKLNEMRSAYEESESSSAGGGGWSKGRSVSGDGSSGGGGPGKRVKYVPTQMKEKIEKYILSESGKRVSDETSNAMSSKPFNRTGQTYVPPRFRKQQQEALSKQHDGFTGRGVTAEPMSPIQHTETYDDKTESKNWVSPENGAWYLEAFYNHFLHRRVPAPTIDIVMGKVERQKGFYGQINYDNKLYFPLEILHTEEEARQNAARAFCLQMGITLPNPPQPSPPPSSSSSSLSSSEVEATRKKIYNIISDSGMFANSLPSLYKETYKEDLPPDFLSDLLQATHLFNIEEPHPKRYIIYKVPEAMVKLAQVAQMEDRMSASLLLLPSLPDVGTQLDVLFSYAYSGDEIYLQKAEHEDLLYQIEEVLQTLSQQAPPSPSEDLSRCLIAACYEGGWYRARVRTPGTNTVSVSFVDYGNKEEVTTRDVRLLPNDKLVTVTPPLAIPCCLQKPAGVEWKEDVASFFFSLSETEPVLSARVLAHRDGLCEIELYSQNGESLNIKVTQPQPSTTTTTTTPTPDTCSIPPAPTSPTPPATPPPPPSPPLTEAVKTTTFTSPTTAAVAALATPEIQQGRTSTLSSKQKSRLFVDDPEPLCLPESNLFAVYVCMVLSESSVLLRIVDDEYSDKLDDLENQIARHFLSWPIPKEVHKANVYACVIVPGENEEDDDQGDGSKFYRVRVLHKNHDGTYKCYMLDHGDHESVCKEQLREIDSALNASLSYQAILASLYGLENLVPAQRPIAAEALIKFTITDGNTFMALKRDASSLSQDPVSASGDGGNKDSVLDPVIVNRVRKIVSCLSDVDPAKVMTIYQDVYKDSLDNVEEIIKHIPGFGFWKKSLEVELVDTSQDEDFNINQAILGILEEVSRLQAQGQDGLAAFHAYFAGTDSGSASVDDAATVDSKSTGGGGFSRETNVSIVTGGSTTGSVVASQQNVFTHGGSMDRVYSYVQEQADSIAAVTPAPASSMSSPNYQQQQQQPSPSSTGRSLYTWSTNVHNDKDAQWMSSRPVNDRPPSVQHPALPHWYGFELNNFSALFILHAESPSDFVAIPYDMRQPLLAMEEELMQHFSVPQKVTEVLSTSCLYGVNRDGVWYRTLYMSSIEHLHRVLYPDYHKYDTVTLDQLYPLPEQFYMLPFLGRKMALGAIVPTSQDWPESVKFWFIQATRHKSMYGLIWDTTGTNKDNNNDDDEDDDSVSSVPKALKAQLVDTSGEEDVIVDDVLCEKGWAKHISVE